MINYHPANKRELDNHDSGSIVKLEDLELENNDNSGSIDIKNRTENYKLFFYECIVKICTVSIMFITCFIIVISVFQLLDTYYTKHSCDNNVYAIASYYDYETLNNRLNNTLTFHGYANSKIACANKICYVISFKDDYKLLMGFYITYNKHPFLPFVKDPKMCILNDVDLLSY